MAEMSQAMRLLTSRETTEWYTPPEIIQRVRIVLGPIGLDPASDPIPQQWIQAATYYTKDDDGLSKDWSGTVFLNPPYNGSSAKWVKKLIDSYISGSVNQAILLVNSAHGYKWYEDLWVSYPICCVRERIRFIKPDGEPGGQSKKGSTLVYFGDDYSSFRNSFEDLGRILFPYQR